MRASKGRQGSGDFGGRKPNELQVQFKNSLRSLSMFLPHEALWRLFLRGSVDAWSPLSAVAAVQRNRGGRNGENPSHQPNGSCTTRARSALAIIVIAIAEMDARKRKRERSEEVQGWPKGGP